ncbi:hypothetical protein IEO21_07515 [Rhodonia placenta]|uniref:Uncharacterized protein n=1 Tax=Rhodonia placenta TaxID=104341 RepID=A0A8H7NYE0_9APHY|nr:hypothetical protein IEO21_07515 [Postia placenta]
MASDYPVLMPVPSARSAVRMPLEESVRYAITNPEAKYEWLWTASIGDGQVRLGPRYQYFSLVMEHEQRCMRWLRMGLAMEKARPLEGHVRHCLNFLRQHALCGGDNTLEPADALARNHSVQRWDVEHRCRDWEALYEALHANWVEWEGVVR